MRILALILALSPAAAMARDGDTTATPSSVPQCQNAKAQSAQAPAPDVHPRTLEQQPVANRYLVVLRFENGCDRPVMARHDLDQGVDAKP